MSVTDSEFGDAICQLVKDLCMQAEALLGKDDDRLEATTELLTQTIWRTVCEFVNVDLKEIRIDEEKLQYMFSTIQGRVLTLWESLMPPDQQCDALKSIATQRIWHRYEPLRAMVI